ncbi:MAG: hypothetical protein R3241_00280, partial [Rheinheimera sp.]|nr:hypothetical protein [Rheinheimera sp.]
LYWYEIAASRGFAAAYLPSAALRWLHYQRSDEAQAPSHLAKAYIWAKVLQQSATAATPADNAAELLMQQILAVMPAQWQQTLNKKVTDHVRHNTVLQQTPG